MVGSTDENTLRDLEVRIQAVKSVPCNHPKVSDHHSSAHLAWRMVIELVVGIMIGFGIGYGLDILLGTMPIFLVVFIFLGFAAGVKTMLRSAKEIQDEGAARMVSEEEV